MANLRLAHVQPLVQFLQSCFFFSAHLDKVQSFLEHFT
jgi:hypothetical protein